MSFKPIRNKLRRFKFDTTVRFLLNLLRQQEKDHNPTSFWHTLLLLKWALEFCETEYPSKKPSQNQVFKLVDEISRLEMKHPTFDLERNGRISKTFTIMAAQQFQYQEPAHWDSIARQHLLFVELSHKHDIKAVFENQTGIALPDLLEVLYLMWLVIFGYEQVQDFPYDRARLAFCMGIVRQELGDELAEKIIELFTVSRQTIRQAIAEDFRMIRNYDLQSFEVSFFTRKPLLQFEGILYLPHRNVLHHSINHFIYEFLKHKDNHFAEELGVRMEKYIRLGLDEVNIPYQTESDLRRQYGRDAKVVDFLVDGHVMIEAKAIELKPYSAVNPTDEILANELRQNIVKAFALQMHTVRQKLAGSGEYFGIIITYKKLHLGTWRDVWDQFLKSETDKALGPGIEPAIPPQHLFFMDLRCWDQLIQVIKDGKVTLMDILREARDADKEPQSGKFQFDMHLDPYKGPNLDLSYLFDAHQVIKSNMFSNRKSGSGT